MKAQRHFRTSMVKRTLAMLIDYMPILLLGYLVCVGLFNVNPLLYNELGSTAAERVASYHAALMLSACVHLVWFLYGTVAEALPGGATFGKRMMGLRVYTMRGGNLSIGGSVVRNFSKLVSMVPMSIGFFWAIVSPGSRAWHDYFARAIVAEV
ncbi:MAG: RDD family protein [Verrucomicrobia bacterium]|nr:RDD family protein [Verrucomicrobiota bacterium]